VDGLGTRLCFLASQPFPPAAGNLVLSAIPIDPSTQIAQPTISLQQPMALVPSWSEELAA
jgi:hypothetical protein